jgi:hypothetical protein
MVARRSRPSRAPLFWHDCQTRSLILSDWRRAVRDLRPTRLARHGGQRREHEAVQANVDGGQPVGMVSLGALAAERDPGAARGEMSAAPPNT